MLITATGADAPLARATSRAPAGRAIAAASAKRVAVSRPIRLANGRAAFYVAVPVEARRFSGELSRAESRSVIVGLVDAQALVTQALAGDRPADLRLSDGRTALARSGSGIDDPARAVIHAAGRRWVPRWKVARSRRASGCSRGSRSRSARRSRSPSPCCCAGLRGTASWRWRSPATARASWPNRPR